MTQLHNNSYDNELVQYRENQELDMVIMGQVSLKVHCITNTMKFLYGPFQVIRAPSQKIDKVTLNVNLSSENLVFSLS